MGGHLLPASRCWDRVDGGAGGRLVRLVIISGLCLLVQEGVQERDGRVGGEAGAGAEGVEPTGVTGDLAGAAEMRLSVRALSFKAGPPHRNPFPAGYGLRRSIAIPGLGTSCSCSAAQISVPRNCVPLGHE